MTKNKIAVIMDNCWFLYKEVVYKLGLESAMFLAVVRWWDNGQH